MPSVSINISRLSFGSILTFRFCLIIATVIVEGFCFHISLFGKTTGEKITVDATAATAAACRYIGFFLKHISLDGYYELLYEGLVFLHIKIIIPTN